MAHEFSPVSLRTRAAPAVAPPRNIPALTSLCLAAADLVALVIARQSGVAAWRLFNPGVGPENFFDFGVSVALSILVYAAFGLYAAAGLSPVDELRRSVFATALVALTLTAGAFLAKEASTYSRGVFLVTGAFVSFLVPFLRAVLRSLAAARPWWGVPVVIAGAGKTARMVIESLRDLPELGLKPVACLDDDPAKWGDLAGVPVAGPLRLAPRFQALGCGHVIVAMPGVDRGVLLGVIERHLPGFSHVIVIPNLFGMASLWVSPRDLGGVLGLELRRNLLARSNQALKRALDLGVALVAGVVALPVIALAALWIRLSSRGPAFYVQTREGQHGRPLRVFKLRTMHVDAGDRLDRHLAASPAARAEWDSRLKLRHDPRVLPGIGRFLRRTSLDELPQLWNVLAGDMSLVGPRPFPAYHLARFDPEFRALRRRVKPGLTGLWQVSARGDGGLDVQQALDSYYIRNWSLWLDLYLLGRTIRAVIAARGAY